MTSNYIDLSGNLSVNSVSVGGKKIISNDKTIGNVKRITSYFANFGDISINDKCFVDSKRNVVTNTLQSNSIATNSLLVNDFSGNPSQCLLANDVVYGYFTLDGSGNDSSGVPLQGILNLTTINASPNITNTNGAIRLPSSGIYSVTYFVSGTSNTKGYACINKNGSVLNQTSIEIMVPNSNNLFYYTLPGFYHFNAGDIISIFVGQSGIDGSGNLILTNQLNMVTAGIHLFRMQNNPPI